MPKRSAAGHTPARHVRVEDALWYPGLAKARAEGTTLSALLREWLAEYVLTDEELADLAQRRAAVTEAEQRVEAAKLEAVKARLAASTITTRR